MYYFNFNLLTFYFTFFILSLDNGSWAMIGGKNVTPGMFPYHVTVVSKDSLCGGALISTTRVITAAHCIIQNNYWIYEDSLSVIVGATNLYELRSSVIRTRQEVGVNKIYLPHDYLIQKLLMSAPDVAILRLEKSITTLNSIYPLGLVLLPPMTANFDSKKVVFTGLGWETVRIVWRDDNKIDRFGTMSLQLRQATAKVLTYEECSRVINWAGYSHLCARMDKLSNGTPQGACTGDSGGPLVYNNYLVGVAVSASYDCNEQTQPSVYIRVTEYLDWITQALMDDCRDVQQMYCHDMTKSIFKK